jgi:O-methyltransferase
MPQISTLAAMSNGLSEVDAVELRNSYLTLLKKSLTMTLWEARDGSQEQAIPESLTKKARKAIKGLVGASSPASIDPKTQRMEGRDWPNLAHSMIGMKRMDNIQFCLEDVIRRGVPGDFIETGVWRGGACIFARGILKAHGIKDRTVWVADSFAGLPPPDPNKYPDDAGDIHHLLKPLAISLEQVKSNFDTYGLLDDRVQFLKGWFKDTLPKAPLKQLAVVRLDGDMYESTMDGLANLYPKLSPGGYLIVDDYGAVPACAKAVNDYRKQHGINDPIEVIDWGGVFWKRSR